MHDELIERVYEAAVIPELWPSVLDGIARSVACQGAALFTTDYRHVTRWTASESLHTLVHRFVDEDWMARNPRMSPPAWVDGASGFVREIDYLTPDIIESSALYVELFRPLGFSWFAGTAVMAPSGDVAVFDIERRTEDGPLSLGDVARLDLIRPHLARAATLSTRLGLEQARTQVEALGLLGLPAAVLAEGGRVIAANSQIETVTRQVAIRAFDRIVFTSAPAQLLLSEALARVERNAQDGTASIALPGGDEVAPAVAHVVPIRHQARDVFVRAHVLLVLTPLAGGEAPSPELLKGLFDLTPAEARLARALAAGQTIELAALTLRVSHATLRTQLKSVFAKTGVTRQAELVRLLSGFGPTFRGNPASPSP